MRVLSRNHTRQLSTVEVTDEELQYLQNVLGRGSPDAHPLYPERPDFTRPITFESQETAGLVAQAEREAERLIAARQATWEEELRRDRDADMAADQD